jgi:Predicted metal binding domain
MTQVVDPAVSRAKFEREIENFRQLAVEFGRRGWFLVEADFPRVVVVMAAPQLQPAPVVTGVAFDFSDYDLRAPSVKLINPFTGEPWSAEQLPTRLPRRTEVDAQVMPGMNLPPGMEMAKMVQDQPLVQVYPDEDPFLCIPGVREYHDHPAHSGDAWELHRSAGAGRLIRLLEVIDTYGVRPLNAYNVQLVTQITGLAQADVPN